MNIDENARLTPLRREEMAASDGCVLDRPIHPLDLAVQQANMGPSMFAFPPYSKDARVL